MDIAGDGSESAATAVSVLDATNVPKDTVYGYGTKDRETVSFQSYACSSLSIF